MEPSGTTEFVLIADLYNTLFVPGQHDHGGMVWFTPTGFAAALRGILLPLRNGTHQKGTH